MSAAAEREACAKRIWDERIAERARMYNAAHERTMAHQGDWSIGYLEGLARAHQLVLSSGAPLAQIMGAHSTEGQTVDYVREMEARETGATR